MREAGSVVALTGAGISVPSGIPDFRSPGTGLWENVDPMEVAHIDAWRADPERFWHFYGDRFATLEDKRAQRRPRALVELERRGHLDAVITQNIDMLHRTRGHARAGRGPRDDRALARAWPAARRLPARRGPRAPGRATPHGVPRCDCGEPLKPDVVLFGELLPEAALERAYALAAGADVLLCIGSSLEVHPVAQLPRRHARRRRRRRRSSPRARRRGTTRAAVKLDGDVVAELEALVAAL